MRCLRHFCRKRKCQGGCSGGLWGDEFWNTFFQPREKCIFLSLFLTVGTLLFMLTYILIGLYYGTLSREQELAHTLLFLSSLVSLVLGVFLLPLFTLAPKELRIWRCCLLFFGFLIALVLGVCAIVLWNLTPTNEQVRGHVTEFFKGYKRVPRVFGKIQQDGKCCGVTGFQDFVPVKDRQSIKLLPASCCMNYDPAPVTQVEKCGNFRGRHLNETSTIEWVQASGIYYLGGCFSRGKVYNDLKNISPSAFQALNYTKNFAGIGLVFLVGQLLLLCYYVCYKVVQPEAPEKAEWAEEGFLTELKDSMKNLLQRITSNDNPLQVGENSSGVSKVTSATSITSSSSSSSLRDYDP